MPFDARDMVTLTAQKRARKARTQRRERIITAIITVCREDWRAGVTPTVLNHEGTLRASLRAGFCLGGMGWREADTLAIEIITDAFRKAGAKRPTWKEAQPEWTDGGVIRGTRTRCANCEKPLEMEQRTYCGKLCFDAHRARLARQEDLEKARMLERLRRRRNGR